MTFLIFLSSGLQHRLAAASRELAEKLAAQLFEDVRLIVPLYGRH